MSNNAPQSGDLFIIAAPSGGGKTSLVKSLLEQDSRLVLSVSHTTRLPRPGESDGQHYHFVSESEFNEMIGQGDFMEHALVFGHHYGTNRKTVAQQLENGRDILLEIDWQGARQVRNAFPDSCSIFILPPSLETLQNRLQERGQDSAEVIQNRMTEARNEISHWEEFDQLLVNNDFDMTLEELASILNDHRKHRLHVKNKAYQRLAQRLGKS